MNHSGQVPGLNTFVWFPKVINEVSIHFKVLFLFDVFIVKTMSCRPDFSPQPYRSLWSIPLWVTRALELKTPVSM